MTTSPLADDYNLLAAALRYAELGYPVLPCVSGSKEPLSQHGHLDATTNAEQIQRWWSEHPDANVGICTNGLLVLDLDVGHAWLSEEPEKLADLTVAPTAITANGGRHYVFRQPDGKAYRNTAGRIADHVDTRADGGYIVAPPSLLSGDKQYRWIEGMEFDQPRDQLPEPPVWLLDELDDMAAGGVVTPVPVDGNKIPSGQRNSSLARLAGNMRRVGMTEAEIGAALEKVNSDRCVPPLESAEVQRITTSIARYEPDQIAVAMVEHHWGQMQADPCPEPAGHADPGPMPDHLLSVPGFIDEVMTYTLDTAPYPQRALAFCGALALQALLAGRKVRDEANNRTNIYLLGLANSGAGKDHPRKVNQQILLNVGMSDAIGDTFASGEGIEDRLFINQSVLFQTDEIDGLMMKINQAKEGRSEAVMGVLLKMYSSSNSVYPMRTKAGKEPGVIDQPCLCIFGTAIPKHYYESLSLKMLTNGFFARMLVLEADKRGRGQDVPIQNIPKSVLDIAQWWVDYVPGAQGNLAQLHPDPLVVQATADAADILRQHRQSCDDQYSDSENRDDVVGMAIWARAHEKARRLALIYACSEACQNPEIGTQAASWATEFVDHQTNRMLFMASTHVSENEFDARCKAVIRTLASWRAKHGDSGMPHWGLRRKHRSWTEKDHDEVIAALVNQHVIEVIRGNTKGRPSLHYRLL